MLVRGGDWSTRVKNIILIRHGQSKEQAGETADGKNPSLSELGISQALQLRKRLSGRQFDLALVSPLDRVYGTFEIARPSVRDAEFDSRLIETDYVENWYQDMVGYVPDAALKVRDGDSWLLPVRTRAQKVVSELLSIESESILLFGHQGIFKYIIAEWLNIPVETLIRDLLIDNTSLTGLSLTESGVRYAQYVNDSNHLNGFTEARYVG